MGSESISTASSAAVLADLRARRDELDRIIKGLEGIYGPVSVPTPPAHLKQNTAPPTVASREIAKTAPLAPALIATTPQARTATGNNGIGEACAKIVERHANKQGLSTRQVTDLLLESGFVLNTKNPTANVWSALDHRCKISGDVEKVGRNWRKPEAVSPAQVNGAH
ncbi:hypothetical protein Hden_3214 [Hyphomicrobium denitrificans ATCC 51888]|uniref:Uncharacterized protein n=1 Tax=Hyphomicrobium denitrificans (strain ATCC 51888 / DSM 1869 / NCIMB 11706 / TK 0415) TaxID=582899 RepID=D8JWQ1_HYPDA|nr:hypothetical protein [Hyphomicrobium denitrificans]ADJ25009.1 hypothetical protein Hden_3214 [Hyphomicrobium denitrificans ATCC 51888]